MNFKTYLVGGAVRDELLGRPCKDNDYVVLAPSFEAMRDMLLGLGCKIFVEKPQFLTIRAHHPTLGPVDFAVARKDGIYSDGRRPDSTSIATTLDEDLARRDFTCNAIAKDIETGELFDPFGGIKAARDLSLICVGSPDHRFSEDRLRVFRAVRFVVQKNFRMDCEIASAIGRMNPAQFDAVATERIREEMMKMFVVNAPRAIRILTNDFPILWDVIVGRGIWLKSVVESK